MLSYLKNVQIVDSLQGHITPSLSVRCLSADTTNAISICAICLGASFLMLCFYHIKRIYTSLVFRDSLKLAELNAVVYKSNRLFSDEGSLEDLE